VVHANPGYSGSDKGTRPGDGEVIQPNRRCAPTMDRTGKRHVGCPDDDYRLIVIIRSAPSSWRSSFAAQSGDLS
jgi:hypothetical protein